MTGSIRYIARNVGDLATLSCVLPSFPTNPVANLQKERRARTFRWDPKGGSPSGQSILGNWGGALYFVSGMGLDRHNLSSAGIVRCRGYASTDGSGAASIDTGNLAPYNASALGPFTWGTSALGASILDGYLGFQYTMAWFARQQIGSFRIDISDDTNAAGYNEISRLVLGDYTEHQRNAAWGIKLRWDEKTTQDEMDGGTVISDGRIPRRMITGTLPGLLPAERTLFADFTRFVGMRKSFCISFQPGEGASLERDFTILQAKFLQMPDIAWDLPDSHSSPFVIFEA